MKPLLLFILLMVPALAAAQIKEADYAQLPPELKTFGQKIALSACHCEQLALDKKYTQSQTCFDELVEMADAFFAEHPEYEGNEELMNLYDVYATEEIGKCSPVINKK